MSVEIGSLVIKASFSDHAAENDDAEEKLHEAIAASERRLLEQMSDLLAEAFRRREEG